MKTLVHIFIFQVLLHENDQNKHKKYKWKKKKKKNMKINVPKFYKLKQWHFLSPSHVTGHLSHPFL